VRCVAGSWLRLICVRIDADWGLVETRRLREQGVSASAETSLTRCAGVVAAGASTFRRVAAQHVLTLPHAFAVVSAIFSVVFLSGPWVLGPGSFRDMSVITIV
jgi:hypothetical protein